jgi:hypothetical protein
VRVALDVTERIHARGVEDQRGVLRNRVLPAQKGLCLDVRLLLDARGSSAIDACEVAEAAPMRAGRDVEVLILWS